MARRLDPQAWLKRSAAALNLFRTGQASRPPGEEEDDGAVLLFSTDVAQPEDSWTECDCSITTLGAWTSGSGYYRLNLRSGFTATTHYVTAEDQRRGLKEDVGVGASDALRRYEESKWNNARIDLLNKQKELEDERSRSGSLRTQLDDAQEQLAAARARVKALEESQIPTPPIWQPLVHEGANALRTFNKGMGDLLQQQQSMTDGPDPRIGQWEAARGHWQDVCAAITEVRRDETTLEEAAGQVVLACLGTDAEAEIVEQARAQVRSLLVDLLDQPGDSVVRHPEVIAASTNLNTALDMDTFERPEAPTVVEVSAEPAAADDDLEEPAK